ncbi:MAG: alpha/beta fold hydrolase [Pirellulaceae bacterium]|jgi:pimeloyl-ACP methyl ester carboxylesterase|nr:alpha/beta fold hydrolase [Pirellulaceae bacterium]
MKTLPLQSAILVIVAATILAPQLVAQEKKKGPPDPEAITLETKDGVILKCTYFGGTLKKNAVPLIMVHGWEGQRGDFAALAAYFQKAGHAVVIPDLRGHGRSTKIKTPMGEETIDRDKMRKQHFASMINDIQEVKRFLMKKHNAGECNIEMLTLVGADLGALVCLNFAVYDWNAVQLPAYKQGRDVKAMVLLSPPASFKGLTNRAATMHPVVRGKLSALVVAGKRDRESYPDAKRLYRSFERYHEMLKSDDDEQDLFLLEPDTSLSGADLLRGRGLDIGQKIGRFVELRLISKTKDFKWVERKSPLSGE